MHGRSLAAVLLDLTYRRHMSQNQIADHLEVPRGTVSSWFMREGIQGHQLAALKAEELLQAIGL